MPGRVHFLAMSLRWRLRTVLGRRPVSNLPKRAGILAIVAFVRRVTTALRTGNDAARGQHNAGHGKTNLGNWPHARASAFALAGSEVSTEAWHIPTLQSTLPSYGFG